MGLDYGSIYDQVYAKTPNYSAPDNSPACRHLVTASRLWPQEHGMGSVIDVGGGPGSLRVFFPESTEYTVLDVSKTALSFARAKQLKIATRCQDLTKPMALLAPQYELALCFDVLEHLHPGDLKIAFKNLAALAPVVFGSICLRASASTDSEGRNLHLSLLPVDTWETLLRNYFPKVFLQRSAEDLIFAAGH